MKRLLLVLIALAAFIFWSYRVRAAADSAEYAPTAIHLISVPADTALQAVIINGLPASAGTDEMVMALLSAPVVLSHGVVRGKVEDLSTSENTIKARLTFSLLALGGRKLAIQTKPVLIVTPLHSDREILSAAFRTVIGAAIGAALGASSGDRRLVGHGLLEGAAPGVPVNSAIPITIVLAADLKN